jgi:hypothetical protein
VRARARAHVRVDGNPVPHLAGGGLLFGGLPHGKSNVRHLDAFVNCLGEKREKKNKVDIFLLGLLTNATA